jgi:hypothetical protein
MSTRWRGIRPRRGARTRPAAAAAWSDDAGETWHPADEGGDRHYTWSVAVDPEDPDLWFVSASTGPFAAHGGRDSEAKIYRRHGDEPWQPIGAGLPDPLPAMPYALVAVDGRLLAGVRRRATLGEPRPRRHLERVHARGRRPSADRRALTRLGSSAAEDQNPPSTSSAGSSTCSTTFPRERPLGKKRTTHVV